jgi:DNA (cytosine-5)-methyltransferase 1
MATSDIAASSAGGATVIDLFAGCGGGSMGFAERGIRPVAAVELDPYAAQSYAKNVGILPIVGDIRAVGGRAVLEAAGLRRGECLLLFGCPPCQSFTILRRGSVAGQLDDIRNSLPNEYLRMVDSILPRHIAFENVPGMIEPRWRPRFDFLLSGLEALGYTCGWDVIDAADYGIPQHRRRLLVVGSRYAKPKLPIPTHGTEKGRKPFATVRQVIEDLRPLHSGECDPADPYHRARRHSPLALRRLQVIPEGGGRRDLPPELELDCHRGHNGHYDIYGRMWWDRPAPTLTSGCTNVTRGKFAHPEQDRAITLREAMRLQSFPDRTELVGTGDGMALQLGNAVPPLLAQRIGRCVLAMERSASQ